MELTQIIIVLIALAILVEVTFLVVKLPRQNLIKKQGRPILVDTSVLIDGRIIAVAQSGFIGDTLVIPRSVIGELQFLADNADHDKRARARYGLDVVKELQVMTGVNVEILQDGSKAEEGVDERLLNLAKKHGAAVCTIDYNLNKVAVVEGITVLNVNELAKSLRMAYLPGEKMMLELVQKGQDSHQGVGYLPDGTMVVVEHANKSIGKTVEIEFIRSLQTAAGKMMFAKPTVAEEQPAPKQSRPTGKKPVEKEKVIARAERPAQKSPRPTRSVAQKPEQQQPEPKPVSVAPVAPAVYHSDDREQRRANKPQANRRSNTPRPQKTAPAAPQNSQQAYAQQHPQRTSKRPKTSSQREAALIDLVQNQ
jgi:rRNA-processing protein FCF1